MKIVALLFLAVSGIYTDAFAQIKYGSNNGKFASVLKTKIYYEEYGKGMPLLLLHGGFGNISNFEKCIETLATKYRVIAADTPGHGRSPLIDSMTYDLLADHFSEFIDVLKLDSVYVMGWSDGAVIGLHLAAVRSDKVKKVLAAGVNYRMDGMDQASINFGNALSVENVQAALSQNEWLKNWLMNYQKLSGSQDSWKQYVTDVKKLWLTEVYIPDAKIKSIAIPVMLVYGDHDLIRLEHALSLYRMIRNCQLAILPATTHDVFNEQPQSMNTIAMKFFK